jgi:hypothetical protein
VKVDSWAAAAESCASQDWSTVELQAQNQLTRWLDRNDRENYQRWNDLVDDFKKSILQPLQRERWEPFQKEHGLAKSFVDSVRWDLLGALMENAYLGNSHRCFFFLELLSIYEAGHFPCGWVGEWPEGKLLVY